MEEEKQNTTNSPNKYGANQFNMDPRQANCWKYYITPSSPTFANAYQSALRAGYEDNYARTITVTEWFVVKVRRLKIAQQAEDNLKEALDGGMDDPEKGGKPIKWKATEFSLKTLMKDEYSERKEITGANGGAIEIAVEDKEKIESNLDKIL